MYRFIFVMLLSLGVHAFQVHEPLVTRIQTVMGTYATVKLPVSRMCMASRAFLTMRRMEQALSSFDPQASLARLNRKHRVAYDPILARALLLSRRYYIETQGYFDMTIGALTKKLYRFGEPLSRLPDRRALRQAPRHIDAVVVGPDTIRLRTGYTIDLGGMGKGFAVDAVAKLLKEEGITRGIVALSGDIRCLHPCRFEIQSPFDENATFATLQATVGDLAISTSGTYRRYALSPQHHHLIDPKQAVPSRSFVSVTLMTQGNNTRLDAYATAVAVMPKRQALEFLRRHDKIGYILVDPEGQTYYGHLTQWVVLRRLGTGRIASCSPKQYRQRREAEGKKEHKDAFERRGYGIVPPYP